MLASFAFFFTTFLLKYNSGKNVWERDWGCSEKGNGSDIYKEQTYLVLAIQAVNPRLLEQGILDVEADGLNYSLGHCNQFMVIKLFQEIFEVENAFGKPEVLLV